MISKQSILYNTSLSATIFGCVCALLSPISALADSTANTDSDNVFLHEEISGLVLDRSISHFGKEFYRHFCLLWREVAGTSGYNVIVVESAIPKSGTLLWVEVNNSKVFQTTFGRRLHGNYTHAVEQAVSNATNYIAIDTLQSNEPDLKGNGY